MLDFAVSHKRYIAAGWFAGFALFLLILWFHRLTMAPRGILLYIGLPTVAAAIAGGLWGGRILNPVKTSTLGKSLVAGIIVTTRAFVIFSVLYSLFLPFVERGWSLREFIGLFLLTSAFGILFAGPFVLLGGMLAASTLYLLACKISNEK